jgi:hypothetical protein
VWRSARYTMRFSTHPKNRAILERSKTALERSNGLGK